MMIRKKLTIVSGDGKDLDISPVYEHLKMRDLNVIKNQHILLCLNLKKMKMIQKISSKMKKKEMVSFYHLLFHFIANLKLDKLNFGCQI